MHIGYIHQEQYKKGDEHEMVKINRFVIIERKRLSTKDIDSMTYEELCLNRCLINAAIENLENNGEMEGLAALFG